MSRLKNSFAALGIFTAGSKIGHYLSNLFKEGSEKSRLSYGAGEISRLGAGIAGGFCIDNTLKYAENSLKVPRKIRGFFSLAVQTIGIGALILMTGGSSIQEQAENYKEQISYLFTFDNSFNSFYIATITGIIKSGARFLKNAFSTKQDLESLTA
jgi:hypothetical protein